MENQVELINYLLKKIKQNPKYRNISNDLIKKEITNYLKSKPKLKEKIKNNKIKKKELKKIIKGIRARLHRIYASYQTKGKRKINFYFDELKNSIDNNDKNKFLEITNKILSTNISTKERINDYKYIYNEIFKITRKPKIIVDLGSGMNPISFPYMNLDKVTYYVYDITSDINFLNNYFEIMKTRGINGKAEILDLTNLSLKKINQLPKSDIVFMFKLIDLIDEKSKKKKKISEPLIKYLLKNKKTKFIVASFSTQTLSGKPMKLPRRTGFEKMLLRNNLKFKSFSTNNEIFYVIYE